MIPLTTRSSVLSPFAARSVIRAPRAKSIAPDAARTEAVRPKPLIATVMNVRALLASAVAVAAIRSAFWVPPVVVGVVGVVVTGSDDTEDGGTLGSRLATVVADLVALL